MKFLIFATMALAFILLTYSIVDELKIRKIINEIKNKKNNKK